MKKIQPLALAAAVLPAAAQAQGTWSGTTNNDWGTATNWNPASVPADGANIVIADTTGSSNQLVLDADRSIGSLQFGTTGIRTTAFSLRSTSAHTLDLAGGLTAIGAFTGVGLTMNGNFSISANQDWNIGGEIGSVTADPGAACSSARSSRQMAPFQPEQRASARWSSARWSSTPT